MRYLPPVAYVPPRAAPMTQPIGAIGGTPSSILPWVVGIGGLALVLVLLNKSKGSGKAEQRLRAQIADKDELASWASYFMEKKGIKNDFEDWVESGQAAREFAQFED